MVLRKEKCPAVGKSCIGEDCLAFYTDVGTQIIEGKEGEEFFTITFYKCKMLGITLGSFEERTSFPGRSKK